jgi:hypothetical protein
LSFDIPHPAATFPLVQSWPAELRLLLAVALNAFVFASAVRFVRRQGIRHWAQVAADAFLVWYLLQYLVIALPGLFGWLSPTTMNAVSIALCAALRSIPPGAPRPAEHLSWTSAGERRVILACAALVLGLIAAIIWNQHLTPAMANDAMTYHLPAAVQWLQTGKLGLYETWFYNPANTYSPLAGSTFAAWMLAPVGNDALARYVEAPALVMIFIVSMQIARCLGAGATVSALLALAVACARPFLTQIILAKDDLFVTAFFATAVLACAKPRLQDRLGPWRLGAAIGLLLATKYTTLLSLPVLLLLIDAPYRSGWRWRQYGIAIGAALVLAGPWYLRNLVLTGNPIFPSEIRIGGATVLPGMMRLLRSDRLVGAANVWRAFTDYHGYYTLIAWPSIIVLTLWAGAWVRGARAMLRQPLIRVMLLGPLVGIAIFVAASPYAEIRFAYPSMLLLVLAAALLLGHISNELIAIAIAAIVASAMIATSFKWAAWAGLVEPAAWCLAGALIAAILVEMFAVALQSESGNLMELGAVGALAAVLAASGLVFVFWSKYLIDLRDVHYAEFWSDPRGYGEIGKAWQFVRVELPPREKLAYSNTYFVYPLQGFELDRPVVYAPVRPGVRRVGDLGHFTAETTGENVPTEIVPLTFRDADRDTWLANLRGCGAKFLLVGKQNIAHPGEPFTPPELTWAQQDPATFRRVFDNADASIFELTWRRL